MALYHCSYVSNGLSYVCRIEASSASEAAGRMKALRWAPGCGPTGRPRRQWDMGSLNEGALTVAVVCILGAAAILFNLAGQDSQLVAAFSDTHR